MDQFWRCLNIWVNISAVISLLAALTTVISYGIFSEQVVRQMRLFDLAMVVVNITNLIVTITTRRLRSMMKRRKRESEAEEDRHRHRIEELKEKLARFAPKNRNSEP